jgi:hypothetical protein
MSQLSRRACSLALALSALLGATSASAQSEGDEVPIVAPEPDPLRGMPCPPEGPTPGGSPCIEEPTVPAEPLEEAPLAAPEPSRSEPLELEVAPTSGLDADGYGPGAPLLLDAPRGEELHRDALYAQDVLKVATSIGFAATGVLGILSAINQPTAFGDGRCSDDGVPPDQGEGIGGNWGCSGMNIVHGALGVGTTLLYTAEQVTGLAIPGDEPDHGTFHQALTYIHVGGMIVTPALGLLSANPRVFGIDDSAESSWPKVGRTIHIGVALLTAASYWTTTLIELTSDAPRTSEYARTTARRSDARWSAVP